MPPTYVRLVVSPSVLFTIPSPTRRDNEGDFEPSTTPGRYDARISRSMSTSSMTNGHTAEPSRFGEIRGRYVPESLMDCLEGLAAGLCGRLDRCGYV